MRCGLMLCCIRGKAGRYLLTHLIGMLSCVVGHRCLSSVSSGL